MNTVIQALEMTRERLLMAVLAFRDGDEDRGCDEMRRAADSLHVALESLREEMAA